MLSRNSNTKGFSERALRGFRREGTRTQPGFALLWAVLKEVTYRAILCRYKNNSHPAPRCVWAGGGQVWFHLFCNTAYYHSTENKQWSLYLHNCSAENCHSHDRIIGSGSQSVPDSLSPSPNKPSIKNDSSLNSNWNHFIRCSNRVSL